MFLFQGCQFESSWIEYHGYKSSDTRSTITDMTIYKVKATAGFNNVVNRTEANRGERVSKGMGRSIVGGLMWGTEK